MSVCGQSGQTEEDSASEEVGGIRDKTSDSYKQKPASKVVRVLTVLAYLLSVSLAAILLSVYYIWVWKSPELQKESVTSPAGVVSAQSGNLSDYEHRQHLHIRGGGDTAVNGSTHAPPENVTSGYTSMNLSESTTDTTQDTTALPDTTLQDLLNNTSDDIGPVNDTTNIT